MIRLATRLTARSGRESVVRLLLTAAGVAVAVTLLLFAAVAFPALRSHDIRRGWTDTREQNTQPAQDESTTDPLLWRLTDDRFDGQDVVRVDVAALGENAPVPPGLEDLPGDGEIAVSPALRDLLESTDPALLGDRFPGEVTATVGRDALASPEDLVVFVGRSASELETESEVLTVRSIESAPRTHDLTRIMRVVFVVGGVGLLTPVVVFVATATRLAAARRERRLAAMRLAGATQQQVGLVAAVEAAVAAVGGTAVGFGIFFAIRPWLARIPMDGASFYPSDLHLSLGWALVVALGVPALAVGAAIVSLRRIRVSPLGVARQTTRSRSTPRPLLLVALGMGLLVLVQATMKQADDVVIAGLVGVSLLMAMLGIALSGPWLTALVARGVGRLGRRAPSLLAARRLQDNPAAGFRTISGLILAVFIGTVFSSFAASIIAGQDTTSGSLPAGVVASPPSLDIELLEERSVDPEIPPWRELDAVRTDELKNDLAAIPGVEQVMTAHLLPNDPELVEALVRSEQGVVNPVLMSCDDAAALGLEACEGVTVVSADSNGVDATGVMASVPVSELADLPALGVSALTDGDATTMELVRTQLELAIPGTPATTQRDIDAENQSSARTTERVSNIALAITLVIAGCSLAVAVAGSIVERKQPFALLRLAGTRLSDLRRIVLAEAAAPLMMVAAASVVLGLAVTALTLESDSTNPSFALPGLSYWLALAGGLVLALLVVLAALPLLNRLTTPDTARFE